MWEYYDSAQRELSLHSATVPHIQLPDGLPGITSGFAFRPETAKPLRELAETLLRGPNSLTSGEREMIAAFVSSLNDCYFCQASHSAAAAHHLNGNYTLVDAVKCDYRACSCVGETESAAGDCWKGAAQREGRDVRRHRARTCRRCDRRRDPRRGPDRRGVLHVQPLRRWPRDDDADRFRIL